VAVPTFPAGSPIVSADLLYMMATKPLFMGYASASQGPFSPLLNQPLGIDVEIIDRGAMHSPGSSQVSIGHALGWYRVTGFVAFSVTVTTGIAAWVALNGYNGIVSDYTTSNASGPAGTFPTANVDAIVQSTSETDYVEIRAFQNNIGTTTASTLGSGQGAMICVEFLGT